MGCCLRAALCVSRQAMGVPTPPPCPSHAFALPHITSGLVQVQTLEEPEPDLKSSSLEFRFRFMKICELDPKSGSRFGEICC